MKFTFIGETHFETANAGKKAAHLHILKELNFPIPAGFVIIPKTIIGPEHFDILQSAIDKIGGFPVAVRSSGHFEDSDTASFAGQYASYLNVQTLAELVEKIEKCRDQARSTHVKTYSIERGLGQADITIMSVLVQKMVLAERAGVTFTIHPMTGKEEESLHEVCAGLGENLVSGLTTPSQYVYNYPDQKIISSTRGTDQAHLSEAELQLISEYAWKASAHFGLPQDIEWAIDGSGKFHFLQSRSITSIQSRTDVSEMTNADLRDGGVSSKVCTTLMYSLYAEAFDGSMQKYMTDIKLLKKQPQFSWMFTYYGRVYWDTAIVKKCLLKVPGFDEKSFDEDLGIQKNYGSEGPVRISSSDPWIILNAIPVALALENNFKTCLKMTDHFAQNYEIEFEKWKLTISNLSKLKLDQMSFAKTYDLFMTQFFLWTEESYFTTIFNNSNLQTLVKDFLRGIDKKAKVRTQIEKLFGGLSDISHLELQRDFIRLHSTASNTGFQSSDWKIALNEFIRKNYFHSDSELDISVPRWEECPEVIQHRIHSLIDSKNKPADPSLAARKQYAEYQAEFQDVNKRIEENFNPLVAIFKKRRFKELINLSRTYLSRREKMREYSTRAYYLVRKMAVFTGSYLVEQNKLKSTDDVFFLTQSEISEVLRNKDEHLIKIDHRKLMYKGFSQFSAPNEFGRGVVQSKGFQSDDNISNDHVFKGLACSSGRVTARVRVLLSIDQMCDIQPGEILVTRFTDPSWTPVLGLISGVITEVGGLLSHAAVISREYGIPAVLNVTGATKIFKTGQMIEINGTMGEIRIQKDS